MMHEARTRYLPMREEDLQWVVSQEKQLHVCPWTEGNFIDSFKAGYYTRVLWLDGEPTAYAVILYVIDEAHLLNIAVSQIRQRQGVATMFLRQLIDDAICAGARQMFLEVRPSNTAARTLYGNAGFRELGRRKHYYATLQGDREDALVMGLEL